MTAPAPRRHLFSPSRRLPAVLAVGLFALGASPLPAAEPAACPPPDQERILARAGEILNAAVPDEAERQVRLQVLKATLTGTVIRPADDYPEMRNPAHWTLGDNGFVAATSSTPVDAIADLWVVHQGNEVPVPRIRCLKYSSLVLIQGTIQYFRETNNAAGIAALNRLIGDREIPRGLPDGGENLLWKRRPGGDHLLPGDQVWFINPFFDHGRELLQREIAEEEIRNGKSPEAAAAAAEAATDSMSAGEEGSNVFYIGDGKFIRGAASLIRLCRDGAQTRAAGPAAAHEQVFTQKIYNLPRFQEHMIDDNYTAQACVRENPAGVRPGDFTIERVRSPISPGNLLQRYGSPDPVKPLAALLDAMASRNPTPRLVAVGATTIPLFDEAYNWAEQQRVRLALDAVMRAKGDDTWWQLRAAIRDDRYALTATRGGVAKNFTVGALCSDMTDARLCLSVTSRLPLVPGRLPASFQPEQVFWEHEAEWAAARKPLHEMQVALCERALQQWDAIPATLPGSDGQAHIYTADEKARYIAGLKKEIAARTQTRQAAAEQVITPYLPAPSAWEGFDAERAKELRDAYEKHTAGAN